MKNLRLKRLLLIFMLVFWVGICNAGQFTNFQNLTPGVRYSSIALGDIDSDGDLDLIMTGSDAGIRDFKVYKNDGNGSFSFDSDISPGVNQSSIALGDIDSDGDLDLIMTGYLKFKVYKNDGNGSFAFDSDILPGVSCSSIALGDIDSDGDLDLIMTGMDSDSNVDWCIIYKNDSNGSFSFNSDISPGVEIGSIALGDIDSDEDLDLIMTGWDYYSGGTTAFKVYKNDGNGSFSFDSDISPGVRYSSIALGDIDSDGDLDLIMTGKFPIFNCFKIYKNAGNGSFSFDSDISPGVEDSSIALGDIDSDGDLDLIMSGRDSGNTNHFKVYKNDGIGNFIFDSDISPGVCRGSIALGDIDSDNDLDLVMTGWGNGITNYFFKVYKNTNTIINNTPSIPTGMAVTNVSNYWRFQWNNSTDDHTSTNLIRYNIAIGTNTSGTYDYISTNIMYPRGQANLGNIPYGNFYQSRIPVDKTCFWKVCAIDSAFNLSGYCAEQTAFKLTGSPEDFHAIVLSTNQIRWIWDDNVSGETNYVVKNSTGTIVSPLLGTNATNWIQTGLSPNTSYTCYAYAFNPSFWADSNITNVYTLSLPASGFISTFTSVSRVGLSWNGNNGSWFVIDRAPDVSGNPGAFSNIATNITITSYTDTGLLQNTNYHYRVSAFNGDGIQTAYVTNKIKTKKGTLTVQVGPNNPNDNPQLIDADDISMLQISLIAGPYDGIRITSIKFHADGSGDDSSGITSVYLYEDLNKSGTYQGGEPQINGTGSYASDNSEITFTGFTNTIPAGTTNCWLLVYDFSGVAVKFNTFRAIISNNSSVIAMLGESDESVTPDVNYTTGGMVTMVETLANIAPAVSDIKISNNKGDINIDYTLYDLNNNVMNIEVEYSVSAAGIDWTKAVVIGNTTGLSNGTNTIIWDSKKDFKGNSLVQIRIIPSDFGEIGDPGLSGLFEANNVEMGAGEVREADTFINVNEMKRARISIGSGSVGNIDIRIYDILGELVREITGYSLAVGVNNFHWDLKNTRGKTVSTGVYWIYLEGNGIKKNIKVVVYR